MILIHQRTEQTEKLPSKPFKPPLLKLLVVHDDAAALFNAAQSEVMKSRRGSLAFAARNSWCSGAAPAFLRTCTLHWNGKWSQGASPETVGSTATMLAQSAPSIQSATLGESGAKTSEISTEELRRALDEKSATVFDVRPSLEFAISHIPGSINVAQKPGTSKAL